MADTPINTDQTAAASAEKVASASIVGDTSSVASGTPTASSATDSAAARSGSVPAGAEKAPEKPAQFNIRSAQGAIKKKDLRVIIKVPPSYIRPATSGRNNELANFQGIIFPYTPTIAYETRADYATINPTHGNYTQYFYQHSQVSAINISGKFTVQNEKDAGVYLATVHLLKALTKMRFGDDTNAGSPPPVCRLSAYGKFMLDNVPVAISSYRIDLPSEVDYFTLGKYTEDTEYGQASVPVSSTIAITCLPMYSRQEMQEFNVTDWLSKHASNSLYI
jgi:hypothetical protein